MSVGYLISITILLCGVILGLGLYACSIFFDNAMLRKREKELQDSFNRARGNMSFDDYRFKDYE